MNATPATGSESGARSSSATSRSFLERAKAKDASTWDRLIFLYTPLVVHWCRGRELAEADIADIVQEVFMAVARHIEAFRKERAGGSFRGWLRTITQNKLRDHFRKRKREPGAVGGTEALARLSACRRSPMRNRMTMPAPPTTGQRATCSIALWN
jgi:RNA polymerase sigma-70 factor (ECF subfamily)